MKLVMMLIIFYTQDGPNMVESARYEKPVPEAQCIAMQSTFQFSGKFSIVVRCTPIVVQNQ